MAQMNLREGTVLGDRIIFPIYELAYDTMLSEVPAAFATGTDWVNTPVDLAGERYHKFQVTSNDLYKYLPATIPRQSQRYGKPADGEVDGAICPVNCNYQTNTKFPVESYNMTRITQAPTDMNTNIHYLIRYEDSYNSSGSYSGSMYPCYRYMINETYSASSHYTNWLDNDGVLMKSLFTDAGAHIYVAKTQWRNGLYNQTYNNVACIGMPPSSYSTSGSSSIANASSAIKTTYTICNRNNTPIVDASGASNPSNITVGARVYKMEGGLYNATYNSETAWTNINMYPFFVHYTVNGEEFYGVCYAEYAGYTDASNYPKRIVVIGLGSEFWGTSIIPGGGGGDGSWGSKTVRGGGNGTFSTSTTQRDKATPGASAINVVVNTNTSLEQVFGSSTPTDKGKITLQTCGVDDLVEALYNEDFIKAYANAYYNPMSGIPVCHMLPVPFVQAYSQTEQVAMTASGMNLEKTVGGSKVQIMSFRIPPTTHIDSNIIDFSNLYFDAFPDFDGYTKMRLHLPYIGEVDINPNWCMGGRLQVTINCDCITGNLSAWIWCEDRDEQSDYMLIATGNCSRPIPIASMGKDPSSIGKIASGLITAVGGLAAVAAAPVTGGASLVVGGTAAIAAGSATAIGGAVQMEHQRTTQVKYDNTGAVGALGDMKFWLEITRPVWVEPENYQALYGLPAYTGRTILECPQKANPDATQAFEGFLVIDAIDLTGIEGPTEEEKAMIEEQLAKGVFIDYDTIGE